MQTHVDAEIETLRAQLSQQLARRGSEDPFVEHLRWQIASLERQSRRRSAETAVAGTSHSTRPGQSRASEERPRSA